jgi:hypothetical protein
LELETPSGGDGMVRLGLDGDRDAVGILPDGIVKALRGCGVGLRSVVRDDFPGPELPGDGLRMRGVGTIPGEDWFLGGPGGVVRTGEFQGEVLGVFDLVFFALDFDEDADIGGGWDFAIIEKADE